MALTHTPAAPIKILEVIILILGGLSSLSSHASVVPDAAGARVPVWSELKTFDQVTDIEAAGDGLGYFIAGPGKIALTSNKGTNWKTIQLASPKQLDGVFADGYGRVIATSKDSYFVGNVSADSWKEQLISPNFRIRSVGFSEQVPGVVWRLEYKDRMQGESGVVNVAVSINGGEQWQSSVQVPWLPNVIKPVNASVAWGYNTQRAFLFKASGQQNYPVDLNLGIGEKLVRGGVVGESLVVATTLGRVLEVPPDGTSIKIHPSIGSGSYLFFAVFSDGHATAVDQGGGIHQTEDIVTDGWRLTGTFGEGRLAFGWRDGGFISRTPRGEVNVRPSAGGEDKIVYDVPFGFVDQMNVASTGVILLSTDSGAIFRSEDRGDSWKRCCLDLPPIRDLVMNAAGTAAVSTKDGRVFLSKDSGSHWAEVPLLPMLGDIGNLLITSTSEILAQVNDNYPYSTPQLFSYVETATAWTQVGISADQSLISTVPGGGIKALSFDGTVYTRGVSGDWTSLKWSVAGNDPPTADNPYSLWAWTDPAHGWLTRKHSVLYRTRDGGESWVRRNLPSQVKLDQLHFFDSHNGFLIGELLPPAPANSIYYATTHDAGDTWVGRNLPAASVQAMAMSETDTGVLATPSGLLSLIALKTIPMISSRVEQLFWGNLSVVVAQDLPGAPNPFAAEAVSDVSLMYKVGDVGEWRESKHISKRMHALDETHYSVDWNPYEDVPDLKLDDPIAVKLKLKNAGESITLTPDAIRYMPPIVKHREAVNLCLIAVAAVIGAAILLLSMYWLSPISLAMLSSRQERFEQILSKLPTVFGLPLRIILIFNPISRLTLKPRVADAWIRAYSAKTVEFEALDARALAYYLTYPILLDAWVARRIDSFQKRLQVKIVQLGATGYVPTSVLMTPDMGSQQWLTPSSGFLKGHVSSANLTIEITGAGGTGKTALLAQIARWCQAPAEDSLLGYTSIALLVQDGMSDPLAALQAQLVDSAETSASDSGLSVIKAAILHKRLVVFIDGLSERDKISQQSIFNFQSSMPGAMLILSSREGLAPNGSGLLQIRPELIGVENIGWFIGQYVHQRPRGPKIELREQLQLSQQLLVLLEARNKSMKIAPIFVVLMIESSIASPAEQLAVNTLAATVQHYVRSLALQLNGPLIHDDGFAKASVALAKLSLSPNFVPTEFDQSDAAIVVSNTLGAPGASGAIDELVKANLLSRRTGDAGLRVRFRLDPVAEYLVAIEQVKTLKGTEQWHAHVEQLRVMSVQGIAIGYTKALRECLLTLGEQYAVPGWVSADLHALIPAKQSQANDLLRQEQPS